DRSRRFSIVSSTTSTFAGGGAGRLIAAPLPCCGPAGSFRRARLTQGRATMAVPYGSSPALGWQGRHERVVLGVARPRTNFRGRVFRVSSYLIGESLEPFGAPLERRLPQLIDQRRRQAAQSLRQRGSTADLAVGANQRPGCGRTIDVANAEMLA